MSQVLQIRITGEQSTRPFRSCNMLYFVDTLKICSKLWAFALDGCTSTLVGREYQTEPSNSLARSASPDLYPEVVPTRRYRSGLEVRERTYHSAGQLNVKIGYMHELDWSRQLSIAKVGRLMPHPTFHALWNCGAGSAPLHPTAAEFSPERGCQS